MEDIILLVLGMFIAITGIINMTGNIRTIHSYNRRKVAEEDVPKYGKAVGLGTLIIGLSLVAAFVLTVLEWETAIPFVIISAIVIGVSCILYAQFKYNKGLF